MVPESSSLCPTPVRHRRRRKGARAGVVAVEFALVSLVLFSLIFGMFEAVIQLLADMALNYGTRTAARFGVTGAAYPPTSREDTIFAMILQASGGFLQQSHLTLQLTNYPPTTPPTGPGASGAGPEKYYVRYQATYTQPFATSLAASLFGQSSIQHQVVIWVQNEPFG